MINYILTIKESSGHNTYQVLEEVSSKDLLSLIITGKEEQAKAHRKNKSELATEIKQVKM